MDSYNLKINVSDTVRIGVIRAKKVYPAPRPQMPMIDEVSLPIAVVWAPTLARSPSPYFNRFNFEATF